MKQSSLAAKLGLTRTSISNIERGEQRVYLDLVFEIADILGVEVVDLMPKMHDVFSGITINAGDSPLRPELAREAALVAMEVQSKGLRSRAKTPARKKDGVGK